LRHALEAFIKRRFFVVHLFLLAVAAILAARTVTVVAGHFVAEKVKASAAAGKAPERRPANLRAATSRDFEAASNANIFEGKREIVTAAAAPIEKPLPPSSNDCEGAPRSSLRLRLVGTVVFSEQASSVASIVDEGKGGARAEMFSVNECVAIPPDPNDPEGKLAAKPPPCSRVGDSAILRRIEPTRVCIWNDGESRMEYLAIDEPPQKGAVVARVEPPKQEITSATDDIGKDIRKTGENSYEVGQGEVDKALNNLAELSTQARIVPAFEGGKTVGFKLFSIRPGSLYSKIGLQNGDVITRINGYEMSSPEKGLEIYTKLKDSKTVTVDVKRRGKPMTLDYNITP
jgi:general secretion pathway protein C